jgi:hypothetical protein
MSRSYTYSPPSASMACSGTALPLPLCFNYIVLCDIFFTSGRAGLSSGNTFIVVFGRYMVLILAALWMLRVFSQFLKPNSDIYSIQIGYEPFLQNSHLFTCMVEPRYLPAVYIKSLLSSITDADLKNSNLIR